MSDLIFVCSHGVKTTFKQPVVSTPIWLVLQTAAAAWKAIMMCFGFPVLSFHLWSSLVCVVVLYCFGLSVTSPGGARRLLRSHFYLYIHVFFVPFVFSLCQCISIAGICMSDLSYPARWQVIALSTLLTVISLSLGRRLDNLLPAAQRTNALTNGVVGRTRTCAWNHISPLGYCCTGKRFTNRLPKLSLTTQTFHFVVFSMTLPRYPKKNKNN